MSHLSTAPPGEAAGAIAEWVGSGRPAALRIEPAGRYRGRRTVEIGQLERLVQRKHDCSGRSDTGPRQAQHQGWIRAAALLLQHPQPSTSGAYAFSPNSTALPGFTSQTGHSFASFLLGAAVITSRSVNVVNPGHRWRETAFYASDDWKVTRRLTLNIGLRWEIIGGLFEVAGRTSGLEFDKPNPGAGGTAGCAGLCGRPGPQGLHGFLLQTDLPEIRIRLRNLGENGGARRQRHQQHPDHFEWFRL